MASISTCRSCTRSLRRHDSIFPSQLFPSRPRQTPTRSLQTAVTASQQLQQTYPSSESLSHDKANVTFPQHESTTASQLQSHNSPKSPRPSKLLSQETLRTPSSDELHAAIRSNAALNKKPLKRSVAEALRRAAPAMTETYVAYGATERLYPICAAQASYKMPAAAAGDTERASIPKTAAGEELGVALGEPAGWWYGTLRLPVIFDVWAQVTFLHMYILTARFRMLDPAVAPPWHQHLVDRFFFDAEDRMTRLHAIDRKPLRTKFLKDLNDRWRGALAGYDEGLARADDAVLAAAVWRNVFRASENVDAVDLATVTSYLRRELWRIAQVTDQELASGKVEFGNPEVYRRVVLVQSELMKKPFEQ